jgi:uncharacterized protein (TIGR03083 family)
MTRQAVDALRADREALIDICRPLDDDQWRAQSGWAGWSVKGLVSHLAGGFWRVVDPTILPDTTGMTTAEAQDAVVASRRTWPSDRVLDDYASVSRDAIDRLAQLVGRENEVSFGDLGAYPASMIPNSFAFDHYTHLRADLCGPHGPLDSAPPPSDELRLVPALDWIAAALPQQNADLIDSLTGALVIEVSGVAARTIAVGPGDEVARVDTDAVSLIRWVSHRDSWADLALVTQGDRASLEIARQLHVS